MKAYLKTFLLWNAVIFGILLLSAFIADSEQGYLVFAIGYLVFIVFVVPCLLKDILWRGLE